MRVRFIIDAEAQVLSNMLAGGWFITFSLRGTTACELQLKAAVAPRNSSLFSGTWLLLVDAGRYAFFTGMTALRLSSNAKAYCSRLLQRYQLKMGCRFCYGQSLFDSLVAGLLCYGQPLRAGEVYADHPVCYRAWQLLSVPELPETKCRLRRGSLTKRCWFF